MMTSLLRVAAFAAVGLSLVGLASAATYAKQDRATLRALDKITGRSTDIVVKVGQPVVYGSLSIELKTCFQTPRKKCPKAQHSCAFLPRARWPMSSWKKRPSMRLPPKRRSCSRAGCMRPRRGSARWNTPSMISGLSAARRLRL
jgi:hypothetical protein